LIGEAMSQTGSVVVIGGTSGLGKEVARFYARRGRKVVISGRDELRAKEVANEIGDQTEGLGLELASPERIPERLAGVGDVQFLVIAAIDRDENRVRDFDIASAIRLTTLKLVGYAEVVHALATRLTSDASLVLFGGLAKERPYLGSTTVSTVNGGISGLTRTLVHELAPIRVNAIHPGIVGDSPYWADKPSEVLEAIRARTPTGRLARMQDIVGAVVFLLENPAMNGVDLRVDGGWLSM
jgi:NAD(P)-dependent dehydrogenase (short-subunit alcohol dehydrogenase family)